MLELSKVSAFYGTVKAITDVSLKVEDGDSVGLIGPNGHGKSSILRAISGLIPWTGSIKFDDKELRGLPPHEITKLGIIHVPEGAGIFLELNVIENLLLGAYAGEAWKRREENLKSVFSLFPVLEERRKQPASSLSGGERSMLAIGRGMMSFGKLLMLDEISWGLAPLLVLDLFDKVKQIKQTGVSILIVEEKIEAISRIADKLNLVEKGEITLTGKTDAILKAERVKEVYLGGS